MERILVIIGDRAYIYRQLARNLPTFEPHFIGHGPTEHELTQQMRKLITTSADDLVYRAVIVCGTRRHHGPTIFALAGHLQAVFPCPVVAVTFSTTHDSQARKAFAKVGVPHDHIFERPEQATAFLKRHLTPSTQSPAIPQGDSG
ncbi:MAG: hypothetical protein UY72_C0024G0004 [Candidatus Uhrbacteria bacterium GW2011_GWD2_52_7]|uniref:Uncharacterized protein n=1 Tax=Candidatus Uhrbacteria bacterium GW2011_GWD2_52_7 TaxID=1618989 RepID=A0A0G1ZPH6_9BACT|nr:MAG: hypothetical protein UY72_C0024G0004 [Candidatus Uhrbacteria bacterium GW2011_GWD2_52_7]